MSPSECIGYTLLQTSAVTAITSTRITHGERPANTVTPSINFYQVGGATRRYGIENPMFSINCRAPTAEAARDLARIVVDTFHGSAGTGMYGYQSSGTVFDVARVSLRADQGLIPEPADNLYNAPVDIQLVHTAGTVS